MRDPLDDPIASSLSGEHRRWALARGRVVRYEPESAPFAVLPKDATRTISRTCDSSVATGPAVFGLCDPLPAPWREVQRYDLLRMVRGEGGRLLAMAGERLQPDGWSEISGVCTHPDARGRGYARVLLEHVAHGIAARGRGAFLHVAEGNAGAVRLYRTMGFVERAPTPCG